MIDSRMVAHDTPVRATEPASGLPPGGDVQIDGDRRDMARFPNCALGRAPGCWGGAAADDASGSTRGLVYMRHAETGLEA